MDPAAPTQGTTDPEYQADLEGSTSVHDLVGQGRLDRLAGLLAADSSRSRAGDRDGRTPLHALHDHRGVVEPILDLLLRHGAELDALDDCGQTPLDAAIAAGHHEAAAALVRRGAVESADRVTSAIAGTLRRAYDAFNRRDIETALLAMHADVTWPNGRAGSALRGHGAIREYWNRRWLQIDPKIYPQRLRRVDERRVSVDVHQVVRNMAGELLVDQLVQHVYEIDGGLIRSLKIRATG